MASGLPAAKWNNADIVSPDVDVALLEAWYARRDVPWGIRVPLDIELDLGRPLFNKRCAVLLPSSLRPAPLPAGVTVRRASAADIDVYADLELAAFGGERLMELRWLTPAMGSRGFGHWIAEYHGAPIATVATVRTDERAGPATYLSGLAVPGDDDSGALARGLLSVVAEDAFARGSDLVHLNPDEHELRALGPLGLAEVAGFLVRVVRDS